MQVSFHTEHEGDQEVVAFRLRLGRGEGGSATATVVILTLSLNGTIVKMPSWKIYGKRLQTYYWIYIKFHTLIMQGVP